MKTIGQVVELLNKAMARTGPDAPFLLYSEPYLLEQGVGFDPASADGIADIRLVSDWPLPGESLAAYEGQHPMRVVAFYRDIDELDSSTDPDDEPIQPAPVKPVLKAGQVWRDRAGRICHISKNRHQEYKYPFESDTGELGGYCGLRADGTSCLGEDHKGTLVELIQDAP
jgi:hypothetical protein